ncbi:MAG: hypothetical protein M1838_000306 [Thelocarpon superellum]|nr:MAG: hypothetical protein M1838_000306 [Thelocarpon superellum]
MASRKRAEEGVVISPLDPNEARRLKAKISHGDQPTPSPIKNKAPTRGQAGKQVASRRTLTAEELTNKVSIVAPDPRRLETDTNPDQCNARILRAQQSSFVWGHFPVCVDKNAQPVSILRAISPANLAPVRHASFVDLPGELRNMVYEMWKDDVVEHTSYEFPRRFSSYRDIPGPWAMLPPSAALLRVHPTIAAELDSWYMATLRKHPLVFDSTEKLHDFLSNITNEEGEAITQVRVTYEGRRVSTGPETNEEGPLPLAFDAFEMLAYKCTTLRQLVIKRDVSLFGGRRDTMAQVEARSLDLEFPGIWGLRAVRGLRQLTFEGYKPINITLRRLLQLEMRRRRFRRSREEERADAQRWRARDSARAREEARVRELMTQSHSQRDPLPVAQEERALVAGTLEAGSLHKRVPYPWELSDDEELEDGEGDEEEDDEQDDDEYEDEGGDDGDED